MIGYLHTGIEKTCEALTYSQAITLHRPHRLSRAAFE